MTIELAFFFLLLSHVYKPGGNSIYGAHHAFGVLFPA